MYELIRKKCGYDRLFCVYPHREMNGLFQAKTIAYPSIAINMEIIEKLFKMQVWVSSDEILYMPSNNSSKCFVIREFINELFQLDEEKGLFIIEWLFILTLRKMRIVVSDADEASRVVAYDVTFAAYDAIAAVAYDVTFAVCNVAFTASIVASAVCNAAFAAYAVAHGVEPIDSRAKEAYEKMKKAFRLFLKFKKIKMIKMKD